MTEKGKITNLGGIKSSPEMSVRGGGGHTWVYVGGRRQAVNHRPAYSLNAVGSWSNERRERPLIDANDIPLNACAPVWVCGSDVV